VTKKELVGYLLEPELFNQLKLINIQIYDDRPLAGDRRRDLANWLDVLLHKVQQTAIHREPV
jgi:hypothetical protein